MKMQHQPSPALLDAIHVGLHHNRTPVTCLMLAAEAQGDVPSAQAALNAYVDTTDTISNAPRARNAVPVYCSTHVSRDSHSRRVTLSTRPEGILFGLCLPESKTFEPLIAMTPSVFQTFPQIQPSNLVPSLPTDPPSNAITAAEDLAPQSKCISAAERALPAAEQKHAPPSRALTQPTLSFANVSKKAVASQAKQTKNPAPEPDDRPLARLSSSIPKNPPALSTGEQTGQAQHQAAIRIVHQEPVVERKRRVIDEVDEDDLGAGLAGIESIFDAPLPEPAAVSSVPPLSQDQPAPSTPLTDDGHGRTKRKRHVKKPRTYMDERGRLVTEDVLVSEEVSDEDMPVPLASSNSSTALASATSPSDHQQPPSKKKAKGSQSKSKSGSQASILSFFSRKP